MILSLHFDSGIFVGVMGLKRVKAQGCSQKRIAFSTYYLRPNIGPIPNEKSCLFFQNFNTKFPNPASKIKVTLSAF
jgi:hypothetical protein